MAISSNIYDLAQSDFSLRDQEWEKAFLNSFSGANLSVLNDTPQVGPDGWPYLMVQTDPAGLQSAYDVLSWLSDKGIGLAVNPQKSAPDYVFSFGMIWNFRQRKEFLSSLKSLQQGQIKFEAGEKVMAGPPSEDYLPDYARVVLRAFLNENKVSEPKILVVSKDQQTFDLCFSLESLGTPEASEHKGLLEALSWFLPAHYSLVIVSENGLPSFHAL